MSSNDPQGGDRFGGERRELALEPVQDRPAPALSGRPGRGPGRGRVRATSPSEWPRSHLRRSRWMISPPERRPVTTGTRCRNRRSTPALGGPATGGISSAVVIVGSQPAGELVRPDSSARMLCPSAAASLSISIRAERRGRAGPTAQDLQDQADVADADRRIARPRLGRAQSASQITSPSAAGPHRRAARRRPGGTRGAGRGAGGLVAEDRARHADAPGQGGQLRRLGVGADDPGRQLGPQADAAPSRRRRARRAWPRSRRRSCARAAR